jgi:hypothetical protein
MRVVERALRGRIAAEAPRNELSIVETLGISHDTAGASVARAVQNHPIDTRREGRVGLAR